MAESESEVVWWAALGHTQVAAERLAGSLEVPDGVGVAALWPAGLPDAAGSFVRVVDPEFVLSRTSSECRRRLVSLMAEGCEVTSDVA